ncbi:MAG: PQQ-binding-like beta-propeller repeat protein [Planctomycetaceae bacterium]
MNFRSWSIGLVALSLIGMAALSFRAVAQDPASDEQPGQSPTEQSPTEQTPAEQTPAEQTPPAAAQPAGERNPPARQAPAEQPRRNAPAVGGGSEAWNAAPMDWPHWRGPEMNGISRETGLVDSWDPAGGEGSNVLWMREDLGGRSTPIVMNGKLYMLVRDQPGTTREGEKVVCVDAATGETIWENRFEVFLSDVPDSRVGWSAVVGDPSTGDVYAQGVCNYFQKIDGRTGKTLWAKSLNEEFGFLDTYGGRTNFPVLHGDLVIVSAVVIGWGEMARPAHRFVGFDKRNGQPVWFNGTRPLPYDTTYSSPITTVIEGQPAIVFGSGDGGVHAFQPQTGKNIWSYDVSGRGINATPLVIDGGRTVICGHSEENIDSSRMGALFAIDATQQGNITKTGEKWRVKEWVMGRTAPLLIDGRLYAIEDGGNLLVVDPATGKLLSQKKLGRAQFSSPLYADGKIYAFTENGPWYILQPDGDEVKVLHQMRPRGGESLASPIVSHGRLYFPMTTALYCVGKADHEPRAEARPAPPQPTPVARDAVPAQVQVVPIEALINPGQEQPFQVRLYNANGQFLRLADKAEFSVEGDGTILDGDTYVPPAGKRSPAEKYPPAEWKSRHHAATVKVKVGELEGEARVRVVPPLPWKFDFADGTIPVTWASIRYRHVPADFDFLSQLEKDDPRAARLYIYLQSGFVNGGRSTLAFDDTTPAQAWTAFLRYLGLIEEVRSVADGQRLIEPSLRKLVDEKFLAKSEWSELEGGGVRLSVEKGPRAVDGNPVALKITTIPLGTRSQGFMGPNDLSDYTVQADVYCPRRFLVIGDENRREVVQLPDMGITAQRYTLDMMGASQQLQLRSWRAQLDQRFAETVPFEWRPETWYTMKLRASVEDGKAVLKGKVWERGNPEPDEWTIEGEDAVPNVQGAPGLAGNAKDAEILYDNIIVTPNE